MHESNNKHKFFYILQILWEGVFDMLLLKDKALHFPKTWCTAYHHKSL